MINVFCAALHSMVFDVTSEGLCFIIAARELATLLNKTTRIVERHLKTLREQGRLMRVGSDKAGHWVVIEKLL